MTESAFVSREQRARAASLGMWVFLGSELLLFAGLFALHGAARLAAPRAFRVGIEHASKLIGSTNTALLLVSSTSVAAAVELTRAGRRRASLACLLGTIVLGVAFLVLKFSEYAQHFRDGIFPGGVGGFFVAHSNPGLAQFWTLYFVSTGLHAIHVAVGLLLLGLVALGVARGSINATEPRLLENSALYWHLIDLIWIFLWPLYYLA